MHKFLRNAFFALSGLLLGLTGCSTPTPAGKITVLSVQTPNTSASKEMPVIITYSVEPCLPVTTSVASRTASQLSLTLNAPGKSENYACADELKLTYLDSPSPIRTAPFQIAVNGKVYQTLNALQN